METRKHLDYLRDWLIGENVGILMEIYRRKIRLRKSQAQMNNRLLKAAGRHILSIMMKNMNSVRTIEYY